MNIALWVIAGLLAAAMLAAGSMKALKPKDELRAKGMNYVDDFSDGAIKAIGIAEVLGAIGLILPPAISVAPILAPIAAIALAALMIGAVTVHMRRGESKEAVPALVLGLLAIIVAWGRFGPYAF